MDEQQYYAFILGYDLLNGFFYKSDYPECDLVFKECNDLAKRFMKSEYYNERKQPVYIALKHWVKDNRETIKNHYNITQEKQQKKKER